MLERLAMMSVISIIMVRGCGKSLPRTARWNLMRFVRKPHTIFKQTKKRWIFCQNGAECFNICRDFPRSCHGKSES